VHPVISILRRKVPQAAMRASLQRQQELACSAPT
jgi:hypothetical protein